jgi:molybdopterin molybdotransferase
LIFNNKRSALITEFIHESDNLEKMIAQMNQGVDLIIVEGLRGSEFKKIEVYRPAHSKKKLFLQDKNVIAIVSDEQFDASVPCLNLNNIEEISNFIISKL